MQLQYDEMENEIRTQEADLKANAKRVDDLKGQIGKLEYQIGSHLDDQSGHKICKDALKTKVEQLEK